MDNIYGIKGRIIGVKMKGLQIWNVYPPSGSNFKSLGEKTQLTIEETIYSQDL